MIDWILSIPAAVKLALVLMSIVGLMRVKVPIGASIFAGSVFLALLFPMSPGTYALSLWNGAISDATIFLLIIVVMILVFCAALNKVGQIDRIIDAFRAIVGESRLTVVAFPALIGLLPMFAGAIFSAPIVKAAAEKSDMDSERAMLANYWFRHIWEYWYPIYPGVVLALSLTGMATGKFILMQLPMMACSLVVGYIVLLHHVKLDNDKERNYSKENLKRFTHELMPMLIVVAMVAILDPIAAVAVRALETDSLLARRLPVLLGLFFGMAWLFKNRGLTWRTLGKLIWTKNILGIILLAISVMMFKGVIEDCGAVEVLRDEFEAWNIHLIFVIAALPFIAGVVLGISIGYVGTSFPLIIALLAAVPEGERLPYFCLAYSFGYIGMMLSPVHLCLIVTNEYFKASILKVYCYLIPMCLILAAFSALLFTIYRAI